MENQLHTVLGASGAIGRAVVKELQNRKLSIRAVHRTKHIGEIESIQADLLKPEEALKAISNSTHVYLCAALPYNAEVWLKSWPLLMQNVIDACSITKANLIFLDNIYMYGPAPLSIPFDENHSQNPISKKGVARKQTADLLMQAIKEQKVNALIGRSADFYGPYALYSPFYFSFLERMLKNKAPQTLAKPGIKHTYSNTLDNGKALVTLALEPSAYAQVWHLPVGVAVTIDEITSLFNKELGTNFKTSFLPPLMRKILSIFIPILKDAGEMLYQFETDYIMSFDKFKKQFPDFKVTPYEQGIKEMIKTFQENLIEK